MAVSQADIRGIDAAVMNGTQLASLLGDWGTAVGSGHSGNARPAYVSPGGLWVDSTNMPASYVVMLNYDASTDVALATVYQDGTIEAAGGGGVADANYGAITTAGSTWTLNEITDAAKLADGLISTAKLADGSVTAAKIADDAVTAAKLADGAISADAIADDAITAAKIVDAAVGTAALADGAVATAKIADNAVTADKIADDLADGLAVGPFDGSGNLATSVDTLAEALTSYDQADLATPTIETFQLGQALPVERDLSDTGVWFREASGVEARDRSYNADTELFDDPFVFQFAGSATDSRQLAQAERFHVVTPGQKYRVVVPVYMTGSPTDVAEIGVRWGTNSGGAGGANGAAFATISAADIVAGQVFYASAVVTPPAGTATMKARLARIGTDTTGSIYFGAPRISVELIATGNVDRSLIASEAIGANRVCVMETTGQMKMTSALSVGNSAGMLGIAPAAIASGASGDFTLSGFVTIAGLTPGSTYYLANGFGGIRDTPPTGSGQVVRAIGYAVDASTLYFSPDALYLEVA